MKIPFTCVLAVSIALLSSRVSASEPKVSLQAQQNFWVWTEKVAIALPGDERALTKLISPAGGRVDVSSSSAAHSQPAEIGPGLFADDVTVVMGKDNRAEALSFKLSGSCIPFSSIRKRYPNLLVIHHGASDLEWNTFGTQVGEAIIAFWFQGTKFGCVRKVEITPAAGILSRLNVD